MDTLLEYMIFSSLLILAHTTGIVVTGGGDVLLGDDATLSCTTSDAVGVRQVTWHQYSRDDDSVRPVVTYSKHSEYQLADSFVGKVDVTVASLNTTTIRIKDLTFADEGCYICTFNVYPSGTERKKACLTVQGISEITSKISYDPEGKDVTVQCSTTGKPAPVFLWNLSGEELGQSVTNDFREQNEDGSFNTTSELVLPPALFRKHYVECVGQSGTVTSSKIIYLETEKNSDNAVGSRHYVVSAVVTGGLLVACCIVVVIHRRRKTVKKHLENA